MIAGTWEDGFIHAGNFAYMAIIALFPFCIVLAAVLSLLGEVHQLDRSIATVLTALPPRVTEALGPVAQAVASGRHGWLLWVGGILGLWTSTSLIETLRDILHRAYDVKPGAKFWRHRLISTGVIFAAVLLLLLSLSSQVLIAVVQQVIEVLLPRAEAFDFEIAASRVVSAGALFASIFTLFLLLTPSAFQGRRNPKWPGATFVTLWWLAAAWILPKVLRNFIAYDLTYGSLAGVVISLFFFWLVGLGMVVGAELNAALAARPEEQETLSGRELFAKHAAEHDNEVQENTNDRSDAG
ncbi:YihY/virulence factor BrkB family protein [Novosphingobium sp. 9]|uniref:YihY/virulence factor BrkB family protein n=1 Tax=Novosphingobium sp. 9 TaxID=2025349 RepID=UPI0021B52A16|nr:YihY/virulence factor BrkB family protein [Novosphingobium sp. 9]